MTRQQLPCTWEYDDYPKGMDALLPRLDETKRRLPKFCATLFAVPRWMTPEAWDQWQQRSDWLEIAPHGFRHRKRECRLERIWRGPRARRIWQRVQQDPRWSKIYKAPWYGHSQQFARHVCGAGYALALKTLHDIPTPAPQEWRCWSMWDANHWDGAPPQTRHYETHPQYPSGRNFKANKTAAHQRHFDGLWARHTPDDEWEHVSRLARPLPRLVNACCEGQIWDGWDCLDHHPQPGAHYWDMLTEMLPYQPNRVEAICLGHSLCYIEEERYAELLLDFWRVLRPGCILRISDADADAGGVWQPVGGRGRGTGLIRSTPSRRAVRAALERVGFTVREARPGETASPHRQILAGDTRHRQYRAGTKFIFEATKNIATPPNLSRRLYLHDPRATRKSMQRWRLPPEQAENPAPTV